MPGALHRLDPTTADFDLLYQRAVQLHQSYDYTDWKGIVVRKPWGCEYEWYAHQAMAIWFLQIRSGASTSFHCHPRKGTSLLLLQGRLSVRSVHGAVELNAGDAVFIAAAAFHQSTSTGTEDALLLEIESPPIKEDLVRVEDKYGRAGFGYEGDDAFSREYERNLYRPLLEHLDGDTYRLGEHTLVHARSLRDQPPPASAAAKRFAVCLDRSVRRAGRDLEIGEISPLSSSAESLTGEYLFF